MRNLAIITGFIPWIVFSIVSTRLAANAVGWSALIAVVLTVISLVASLRRNGPRILNLGSLVLFGVIAVVGFIGDESVDEWLYWWGVPLVGVVLGLYVLATVPVLPFTAEYARMSTPREYWNSPLFKKINTTLSAAWGAAILVMGLLAVAATAVTGARHDPDSDGILELVLNWVAPIAIIWFMVKFTVTYPEKARAHAFPAGQGPGAPAGGAAASSGTAAP